ncbi:hypothetical protein DX03_08395 [Stenotrophomonas rhizophila]|nr:hypothetical protein DX03_08395 [Stenotrophomonas rhizophila]
MEGQGRQCLIQAGGAAQRHRRQGGQRSRLCQGVRRGRLYGHQHGAAPLIQRDPFVEHMSMRGLAADRNRHRNAVGGDGLQAIDLHPLSGKVVACTGQVVEQRGNGRRAVGR